MLVLRSLLPLAVLIVAIWLSLAWPARALGAGERSLYRIELEVDRPNGVVVARQVVHYVNGTGVTLDSVVFKAMPAHYRSFWLDSARVGGRDVMPGQSGWLLDVPLPAQLPPDGRVEIELRFRLDVPSPGNMRFGNASGVLVLGNWYPVLSVYRVGNGWDRGPFTEVGDAFYTETADYEVTLRTTTELVASYTGQRVGGDGLTRIIRADGVRDFAIALSERFQTQSTQVGNTTITAYFRPGNASGGATMVASAARSLAWFNQQLGAYPFPTLDIVEAGVYAGWEGQEYPQIVFIAGPIVAQGGGVGSRLDYLVIHEVLHQWFYSVVGNDQLYEPWLDEALTSHVSYEHYRLNYPTVYSGYWSRLVSSYRDAVRSWGDRPVNTSVYDYRNASHYFAIVYRKGAIFLDELRQRLGDDGYYALLRDYYSRFRFGLATGPDFLDLVSARGGEGARSLINANFTYPQYQPGAAPRPALATPRPPLASRTTVTATRPALLQTPTLASQRAPLGSPSPSAIGPPATASALPTRSSEATAQASPRPAATVVTTRSAQPDAAATATTDLPSSPTAAQPAGWASERSTWLFVVGGIVLLGLGLAISRLRPS
ncbi:MAG: hypothetical protein HY329_18350 [Chloroflexi bacterium]|nr:hypothetical protein [Chloroflexota bacterium]